MPALAMSVAGRLSASDDACNGRAASVTAVPSPNLTYALRVTGRFTGVRTRTVMAQRRPYPPLSEATEHEPITTLEHVTGTLAGFRTPVYEQGISVAGYHLHYLTHDRRHGGHALDYVLDHGQITI
jgi:acetolactate decarboxylase